MTVIRYSVLLLTTSILLAGCASDHPRAVMHTSMGEITLTLDRASAPVTVDNFIMHARAGHYDGTIIHRVVPGFVIQGGGWTPDLAERAKADAAAGRPDTLIKNEWSSSGLKNLRGTIAMAREKDPDSATREFFINLADNAKLDTPREVAGGAGYAVFGRVISGMDVVDAIARIQTAPRYETGVTDGSMENVPTEPVILQRVMINR